MSTNAYANVPPGMTTVAGSPNCHFVQVDWPTFVPNTQRSCNLSGCDGRCGICSPPPVEKDTTGIAPLTYPHYGGLYPPVAPQFGLNSDGTVSVGGVRWRFDALKGAWELLP